MQIPFKRGDTFLLEGTVTQNSTPQDITGWTIRSQVRNGPVLIAALTVNYLDRALGKYQLRFDNTSNWPVRSLQCDIEYTTSSGQVVSSETFDIEVAADITQ